MNLKSHILARITANGPISVADYMIDCLLHPTLGYYTTQDPLGVGGDFTTAPEISQMFGELIGLSLAQAWLDQGAPTPFALAELGPGRGTLMADVLRATKGVAGFHDAAQVHLVEASPVLRTTQASLLDVYAPKWHDTIATLPDMPLFLVANEFFDALPIRQFVRDGSGWRERQVGAQNGNLTFGLAQNSLQPALAHRIDDTKDGDLIEDCPSLAPILSDITTCIQSNGGAALIIDYGDWRSLGDTLQAVQNHTTVDPLDSPGAADLTAHVDFEALCGATTCAHSRVTPQGVFLERLGITQRAQVLAKALGGTALEQHIAAHHRLTHPSEMGNLFKIVGLYPTGTTPPPGLEP